jgi:hypothetical protein
MLAWTLKLLSPLELVPNRSRSLCKSLERSTYAVGRGWGIKDESAIAELVEISKEVEAFRLASSVDVKGEKESVARNSSNALSSADFSLNILFQEDKYLEH